MSKQEDNVLPFAAPALRPPGAIRRAAQAEAERLQALARDALPLVAPLRDVVSELREAGIDASLRMDRPRSGDPAVRAILRCPRIHETRDDGLPPWPSEIRGLCAYEIGIDPGGAGMVCIQGPVDEAHRGAKDRYFDASEPSWRAYYGRGRGSIEELAGTIRSLAVARDVEAILQGPAAP